MVLFGVGVILIADGHGPVIAFGVGVIAIFGGLALWAVLRLASEADRRGRVP